jgi:cell wall-associated NlpC family hydrolase
VSTLPTSELAGFSSANPGVQAIIVKSLELTRQQLAYVYGSSDPVRGGLDCSGFVYYVLREFNIKGVPRQSNEQYAWVRKKGRFFSVLSSDPETFELEDLQPGDLMFWTNTYKVERDIPITHVMIYLGKRKSDGQRVMVGASEGRTYKGASQYGVSVFDFHMPSRKKQSDGTGAFVGYGRIPGIAADVEASETPLKKDSGGT